MTDKLVEMEDNKAPKGALAGTFSARDGCNIRYAIFNKTVAPHQGTVVILHGRNECIEKYFETVKNLSKRGLAVATFDWRGQGGSDRLIADPARGYVDSFDEYVGDLETFFEKIVLPDCPGPYFILGHSTGSLVALLAAPLLINRIERMVLCAPLIELHSPRFSMRALSTTAAMLNSIGLGRMYLAGGPSPREVRPFAGNKLTTDKGRYQRNTDLFKKARHLGLGGPTVSWVSAFCRASAEITDPDFIAGLHIPVLIVAAGADEVVSNLAIEKFAHRMRSGQLVTIIGARHEILQEADHYREQFFAAFDAFVPGSSD